MTRTFADPRVLIALAVLSAGAALSPAPLAIRVLFALPLALVLPGLALSLLFLPESQGWAGRLPVSVATTFCLTAVSGLLLTWSSIGLTRFVWVPLLAGVTILSAALAWRRATPSTISVSKPRLRKPGWPALALLAAAALVAAAVALARTPLSASNVRGYSALWILPGKDGPDSVRIGVINSELGETSYRIVIYAEGRAVFGRPLTLSTGERWSGVIDVSSIPRAKRSFDARLFKREAPDMPYREATLVLPGATLPPTTGVWLVSGPVGSPRMRVVVASAEPRRERFRLEVSAAGRVYAVRRLVLRPGERWSETFNYAPVPRERRSFEALLYRVGVDVVPYRQATLVPASG
jgi:uncharacterized membrane protein